MSDSCASCEPVSSIRVAEGAQEPHKVLIVLHEETGTRRLRNLP